VVYWVVLCGAPDVNCDRLSRGPGTGPDGLHPNVKCDRLSRSPGPGEMAGSS
jgi:hypothetical protein